VNKIIKMFLIFVSSFGAMSNIIVAIEKFSNGNYSWGFDKIILALVCILYLVPILGKKEGR